MSFPYPITCSREQLELSAPSDAKLIAYDYSDWGSICIFVLPYEPALVNAHIRTMEHSCAIEYKPAPEETWSETVEMLVTAFKQRAITYALQSAKAWKSVGGCVH